MSTCNLSKAYQALDLLCSVRKRYLACVRELWVTKEKIAGRAASWRFGRIKEDNMESEQFAERSLVRVDKGKGWKQIDTRFAHHF